MYNYYRDIIAGERLPLAYVDMDMFDANIATIRQRAGNKKIRIASKSIRCRALLRYLLDNHAQFQGIMCYTADEAVWLSQQGFDDLLVAYPTIQAAQLRAVAAEVRAGKQIYLMTDSPAHLQHLQTIAEAEQTILPISIDLDMSSRWPVLHFGVHRSGIWNLPTLQAYLDVLKQCPNLKLVAAMGYEAQIAGVGDQAKGKALMNTVLGAFQRRSRREVSERRRLLVDKLRAACPDLRIVNGGGTGSLESTREEDWVTELAVGSGFYAPVLFDAYSRFQHQPAAGFAIEIVRKPQAHIYTCLGGGYVASGAVGPEKAPLPYLPQGVALIPNEMAGEVQTPIQYKGELTLKLGDPIFMRHSKAGELCEHFQELTLIKSGKIIDKVKTYRGEGKCFV